MKRFLILLLAILLALLVQGLATHAQTVQARCRAFSQTGKTACGAFLRYWENNGGLARQGLPISSEFDETSRTDGKVYKVQYFERAVFEYHPENRPPYDVLLSLLGSQFLAERYPNGAPEMPPPMNPVAGRFFAQTGKEIRQPFLAYWQDNGRLAQFGYPISNPFREVSQLNGKEYVVQYFERAVMELHPENAAPNNLLLSQLGTYAFRARYSNVLKSGMWGGNHIGLAASAGGAQIDYDCAHGSIDEPIVLRADGSFEAFGTHVLERPGPIPYGQPEDSHPARYSGITDGKTMTLTVTMIDLDRQVGTFVLYYGQTPKVFKCQ
jgi:hypothetical protein